MPSAALVSMLKLESVPSSDLGAHKKFLDDILRTEECSQQKRERKMLPSTAQCEVYMPRIFNSKILVTLLLLIRFTNCCYHQIKHEVYYIVFKCLNKIAFSIFVCCSVKVRIQIEYLDAYLMDLHIS